MNRIDNALNNFWDILDYEKAISNPLNANEPPYSLYFPFEQSREYCFFENAITSLNWCIEDTRDKVIDIYLLYTEQPHVIME